MAGFLNKENVVEDLMSALRSVSRGEVYVSSKISQYLVERAAQKGKEAFQCAAFNPLLSLAGENNNKQGTSTITDKVEEGHVSDKVKWFFAYAQQQLQRNPEQIYSNLKYHICMVTPKRQKLFTDTERYIEIIADCLRDMKSDVKGIIKTNM